jgi:hypothetical protein
MHTPQLKELQRRIHLWELKHRPHLHNPAQ